VIQALRAYRALLMYLAGQFQEQRWELWLVGPVGNDTSESQPNSVVLPDLLWAVPDSPTAVAGADTRQYLAVLPTQMLTYSPAFLEFAAEAEGTGPGKSR